MANTFFSKIVKSLWVLASFIPTLNGLGFAYIGAKEFKNNWIIEGVIYEIPWFLLFIFVNNEDLGVFFATIGLLGMAVSFVRSLYVYYKHKDILIDDDAESRISTEKSISSFWIIFSVIIFLNGLGLIYVGFKRNVRQWILEGAFFEFLWLLFFITPGNKALNSFIISLGFIGMILSVIRTFMVYFEEERMDGGFYSPTNLKKEPAAQDPIENTISSFSENNLSDDDIVPEFKEYKTQVEDLKDTFKTKEDNVNNLLAKRFTKEELSYGRFKSVVNEFHKTFYSQADSTLTMINLAPEYSERVDETIKNKIGLMDSLLGEMNNLLEELILNDGLPEKSDEEITELFDNMHNLINSVDDYNKE